MGDGDDVGQLWIMAMHRYRMFERAISVETFLTRHKVISACIQMMSTSAGSDMF